MKAYIGSTKQRPKKNQLNPRIKQAKCNVDLRNTEIWKNTLTDNNIWLWIEDNDRQWHIVKDDLMVNILI